MVLPPDSEHLIHHEFVGGALVMAKMLAKLTPGISKEEITDRFRVYDNLASKVKKEELPDRFLHISLFEPAPAQKQFLEPGRKYVRIRKTEDAADFDEVVQVPLFEIERGEQPGVILGGRSRTGNDGFKSRCEDIITTTALAEKIQAANWVYLVPKEIDAGIAHADTIRNLNKTCLIACQINLSNLAKEFPIQEDTSYERTVGEICRAVRSCAEGKQEEKLLSYLSGNPGQTQHTGRFDTLIVRIGNSANLVITSMDAAPDMPEDTVIKAADSTSPRVMLYYHPARCAPTRFPGLGDMLAYDLLLAVSMADRLNLAASGDKEGFASAIASGAKVGVQAAYECFLDGFASLKKDVKIKKEDLTERAIAETLFSSFIERGLTTEVKGYTGQKLDSRDAREPELTSECKVSVKEATSPNQFWRMVFPEELTADQRREKCGQLAADYIYREKGEGKSFPIVEIGGLKLVDRHEVEDYLYLQNLLLDYHADAERLKPLSIGVFGQPGAGKSFGVKQLVSEMSGDGHTFAKEEITINMSQMKSMPELTEAFHSIRDACLKAPIPLVFFDEFDSGFEGKSFGWLKYFLAPMQDGEFVENGKRYHFGRAVFVFAGGVNHSFSEFNERSRNPDFCDAKGPDFISRLRGILNIRSMSQPEADPDNVIYKLRRAVFLRYILEKKIGQLGGKLIGKNLVEAFLNIGSFKHGVRSIEAILDMSRLKPGETFTVGDLPPRDQLDMHVDARAFLKAAGVTVPKEKGS